MHIVKDSLGFDLYNSRRLLDHEATPYKEFLFGNCSKVDQTSRNQIMTQSQIRILCTATISVSQSEEMSRVSLSLLLFISI